MPSSSSRAAKGRIISRARLVASVSVTGLLLASLYCLALPDAMTTADHLVHDWLTRLDAEGPVPDHVTIVDIDEESLALAGQWPWPRYLTGGIVSRVAAARPQAVGVDLLFSEPDRTSIATIRRAFKRNFGLDIAISGVPSGMEDNDAYLGSVLGRAEAVGAVMLLFDFTTPNPETLPRPVRVTGDTDAIAPQEATGVLCNTGLVQAGLAATGFINVGRDKDGAIRHLPMLHRYQDHWYPSLALAIFMQLRGARELRVESEPLGPVLVAGDARIPVDGAARMRLRFNGPARMHRSIPAVEVLRGAVPAEQFAGRIVLLGGSAASLNDLHFTPVAADFPGTELHAVALDNLLEGNHYRDAFHAPLHRFLPAAVAVLLAGLLFARLTPLKAGIATLGAALAYAVAGGALFMGQGAVLPVAAPMGAAAVQVGLLSLALYTRERRKAFLRLHQLHHARQMTLESMTAVAESRDDVSGAHIKRTQHYVRALAETLRDMGNHPQITDEYIDLLFHSAPLHDVGKVAIPDNVLLKPGKLTPEEFAIIRQHVRHGRDIIANAAKDMDDDDFLRIAAEIAWTHHEKWDGSGYLQGLAGEAIPLSGRLMALADVYDALISARPYKPAFPHAQVREMILEGRGTHFDPAVVDAFLLAEDEFRRTADAYRDPSPAQPPA